MSQTQTTHTVEQELANENVELRCENNELLMDIMRAKEEIKELENLVEELKEAIAKTQYGV